MDGKKEDGQMENGWKEGRWMDGLLLFNSHSHLVSTDRHHFIGLCFIVPQRYCIFYKWKIRGNPVMKTGRLRLICIVPTKRSTPLNSAIVIITLHSIRSLGS